MPYQLKHAVDIAVVIWIFHFENLDVKLRKMLCVKFEVLIIH